MNNDITLEANGEFPFKFYIEKAVPVEEGDELIIEGIASTTNVDHDNERMSSDALKDMAMVINEKSVPLRVEHSKDDTAVIGKVYKAWVDERNQLHIRASLDKSHPVAPILHSSMKQGVKMGLSVGGVVKRATKEFVESVGKMVKTFYDVVLNEVSVTPRPANYDSWLVAKSIVKKEEEAEGFRNSSLHNEFLFQNPQLDYLQVFAKSIPDKAWHKVEKSDINKNNNTHMDHKEKKADDMKEETEKSVSRVEFESLKTTIGKGFDAISGLLTKMAGDSAKDTVNPDKKKPEDESSTAKAETEDDEKKEKAETETETKEKATDDDKDEKKEEKKSESESDYKLETVERSISAIEGLTKRLSGMKKSEETETDEKKKSETETDTEKAEDEDETETKKGMHPLDQFVMTVTKALTAMTEKMEKSGKTVLGFEKSIVESMKSDPALQEEIMKMMKIPGQKRSVAMGVPYMVTKEGKRYALSATEIGSTVEKSRDDSKAKTFKDVYKSEYSSVKTAE